MTNTLEKIVTIIGSQTAEEVLLDFIGKSFKSQPQKVEVKIIGKAKKKHKKFILGAPRWTTEQHERLLVRFQDLKQAGMPVNQICRHLSQEFGRTPSSINNRLYKFNLI